jgi:integrase
MLHLVGSTLKTKTADESIVSKIQDHNLLLEGYLRSHKIRNHSARTCNREHAFLKAWFLSHSTSNDKTEEIIPLFTWEAMKPIEGRQIISDYAYALVDTGLTTDTVRAYVGILSRYFSYVLENAFVATSAGTRHLHSLYGPIEQPVSEYSLPKHVYDGEKEGLPMDPEKIYNFYSILRKNYLSRTGIQQAVAARNYTAVVLAGESGLRINEIIHLDIRYDLLFESKKIQTRFAKGTQGSGKRSRRTLFPPLARDTVSYYLKEHRPYLIKETGSHYLFPSNKGNLMTYSSFHEALVEMLDVVRKSNFPVAPNMTWHWFRRIFATRFIERFPQRMDVLISLLGHSSLNTVHRYIRHSEAWMDKQMQAVIEGESTLWQSFGD